MVEEDFRQRNGSNRQEGWEAEKLAPYATKSTESRGRRHYEEPDPYRACFQRDRDRIIYSTAFRRLQYKTQVFVVHEGDFYRTRLTHTIEVMQHARTLARTLRANEDLAEAIALAHDIGHPPFGHAGEEELRSLMKDYGDFEHNLQSLRIVDELEKRYPQFDGLNLTYETREGIARHETKYDTCRVPEEFSPSGQRPSIEAQIVSMADQLAFCAHDLDDALGVGIITPEMLDEEANELWVEVYKRAREELGSVALPKGGRRGMIHRRSVRHLIDLLNRDVVGQTARNLEEQGVTDVASLRQAREPVVALSSARKESFDALSKFLEAQVYENPVVTMMVEKGRLIVRRLFEAYMRNSKLLPEITRERLPEGTTTEAERAQVICDYIAGMTDRFAMDVYEMMYQPYEKVLMAFKRE